MVTVILMYDDGHISFEGEHLNITDVQMHINGKGEFYSAYRLEFAVPLEEAIQSYQADESLLDRLANTDRLSEIVVRTEHNNYRFKDMDLRSMNTNEPKTYTHMVFVQ